MQLHFGFNEEEEYVPPPELIKGLVSKDSLTFIYGHPGTGKSILAMGLAATLAEEEQTFFGRACSPSIVIVLCGEDLRGMREKNAAIHKKRMLNGYDDVVIGVLGGDELSLVGANVSQTVTSVSEAFEEAESFYVSRSGKPLPRDINRVLIADTWSSLTPGMDENSAKETSVALQSLQRIKDSGVDAVFVTHHSGKSQGKSLRGHSGLSARADNIWHITKKGGKSIIQVEKAKHHENGERFGFEIGTVEVSFSNAGISKTLPYFRPMSSLNENKRELNINYTLLLNEVSRLMEVGVGATRRLLCDNLQAQNNCFAGYQDPKKAVDRAVLLLVAEGWLEEKNGVLSRIDTAN